MKASGYLPYIADRGRYSQAQFRLKMGTPDQAFNVGAIPGWPAPFPRAQVSADFLDVRATEAIPPR